MDSIGEWAFRCILVEMPQNPVKISLDSRGERWYSNGHFAVFWWKYHRNPVKIPLYSSEEISGIPMGIPL